jgi:dienelactone hydrolase
MALPALAGESLSYSEGDTTCIGYLAKPSTTAPAPGVIIIHEWWGLNDHARNTANRLAEAGYFALAADMYGNGHTAKDAAEAGELAGRFKNDPVLARQRFEAALSALKSVEGVDASRIAAIGFCFGGTVCLEMARQGLDLKGVVSFHGGLKTVVGQSGAPVRAKVLVCHGADDPLVSAGEIADFEADMRARKADWQLIKYSDAVHSFTNPSATGENPAVKYNETAARRSWAAMMQFFGEIFD